MPIETKSGNLYVKDADGHLIHLVPKITEFNEAVSVPAPTDRTADSMQAAPVSWVRDELRFQIETATGGRNTIVRDDRDNPHVMVVIPRFRIEDVASGLGSGDHPAFIVNGVKKSEILVGKYLASKSSNGRACSVPRGIPWNQIAFGDAVTECRKLGSNFFLTSNAVYAARSLWLLKQRGADAAYYGNTNYGRDYTKKWLTGTLTTNYYQPGDSYLATSSTNSPNGAVTLTGTGGTEWNDDGTPYGLADFVGNVWEWCSGVRTVDGEIQIIEDNNAMTSTANFDADSTQWKAFQSGNSNLFAPGTANTLKYDSTTADPGGSWGNAGSARLNTTVEYRHSSGYSSGDYFHSIGTASGVTPPYRMKLLALMPIQASGLQGCYYTCNNGEFVAARGGAAAETITGCAGPFALCQNLKRTDTSKHIGFRLAYVV